MIIILILCTSCITTSCITTSCATTTYKHLLVAQVVSICTSCASSEYLYLVKGGKF
jgi:hypothetical protein